MMTGQTSQVWEVVETAASGRHFALKLLLPEHVHNDSQRYFLFHEAEVGRQVTHPKIIKILSLVKDKDLPYMIMEFFPSSNVKLRLMRKDPLVREKARQIIEQAATALAYMHEKKWVHRDVKPDNILVNGSGEVRLIDFALAKRMSKGGFSLFKRKEKAQGTRSYMSPEQIRGADLDGRADIYSFGATVYEMVAGRPPFRAASPGDLLNKQIFEKPTSPAFYNPDVTEDLASLTLRMLSKKREERPRDFLEVLAKFRTIKLFKSETAAKQGSEDARR
jgi:serine/threonine-protein kinase